MSGRAGRTGLTRVELVVSVFIAVLAAVGIAALVPSFHSSSGGSSPNGSAGGSPGGVTQLDVAAMAGPRAAAALPACPSSAAGAPDNGPLAGIEVPCLGAPGTVRPAKALAGRETLLNIWATWCVPCREELPALVQYAARPGSPPVVTVNVHDNPVTALNLLHDLKVKLPAIVDSGDAMFSALRIVALPASFVVHPDGTLTQLLPQEAYTTPDEIAAAVDKARAGKVGP
ncbi:MAG TPA: TlpA disulfide reductase family protein [Pseudonocardia sp.]|nr:TlpA disulfide reductase family protein [Pseudonocardia sp.]